MRRILLAAMVWVLSPGAALAQVDQGREAGAGGGVPTTRYVPPGGPEEVPVDERFRAIEERRRGLLSRDEAVAVNVATGAAELVVGVPLVIYYRHSFRNRSVPTEYLSTDGLRLMRHAREPSNIPGITRFEAREIADKYIKTIGEPAASRVHPVMAPAVQVLRLSQNPVYRRGRYIQLEFNDHVLLANGVDIMERLGQASPEAMQAIRRLTKEQLETFNRAARNWQTDLDLNSRLQLHKFFMEGTPEYAFLKGLEDARRGFPNLAEVVDGGDSTERIPAQYRDLYQRGYSFIPDAPHTANLTIRPQTLKILVLAQGVAHPTLVSAIEEAAKTEAPGRSLIRAGAPQRVLNRAQTIGLILVVGNGLANLYTALDDVQSGRIEENPHLDFCGAALCWDRSGVIKYPVSLFSTAGLLELLNTPRREADAPSEEPVRPPLPVLGGSAGR